MILFPKQYITEGSTGLYKDVSKIPHYHQASNIAKLFAKHYLSIKKPTFKEFNLKLFGPGIDYRSPGERFVLGDRLQQLAGHAMQQKCKEVDGKR